MSLNREWSHQYNVAGVSSQVSNATDVPAPKGFYFVTIEDCYIDTAKNPNNIKFRLVVSGGEFQGSTCWGSLMQLGSTKNDNSRFWRALYESIGLTPAQLDQGAFNYSGKDFIGQSAHIYWIPGDRDAGVWDDCKFLSPSQWTTRKQQFEATASAPGAALASPSVQTTTTIQSAPIMQTFPTSVTPQALHTPTPKAGFVPDNAVGSVNMKQILGTPQVQRPN